MPYYVLCSLHRIELISSYKCFRPLGAAICIKKWCHCQSFCYAVLSLPARNFVEFAWKIVYKSITRVAGNVQERLSKVPEGPQPPHPLKKHHPVSPPHFGAVNSFRFCLTHMKSGIQMYHWNSWMHLKVHFKIHRGSLTCASPLNGVSESFILTAA